MPRSSGSMGGFTNTFGLLMAGRAAIKVLASRIVEEAMTVTPEVVSWWEDELKRDCASSAFGFQLAHLG